MVFLTVKGVVIAAVVFLSYSVVYDLRHMDETTKRYFEVTESTKYHPRFWLQGLIGEE